MLTPDTKRPGHSSQGDRVRFIRWCARRKFTTCLRVPEGGKALRIRTIKPEFWTSEKLASVPEGARLLFIGLWGLADDYGNGKANPLLVRAGIFPFEDDVPVSEWLDALENARLIERFTNDSCTYFHVSSWEKHQAAAYRRGEAKHPGPQDEGSSPIQPARDDVQMRAGREQGREQGTGNREGKGRELAALAPQQFMFGEVCLGMGYPEDLNEEDAKEVGGVAKALIAKRLEPPEFASYLTWLTGPESPIPNGTRVTLHSLPKWVKDWRAKPRVVSKPSGVSSAPGRTLAQAEELRRAGL